MISKVIKNSVIKLRLQGFTYSDINRKLNTNITKSTFSNWFKNLTLSDISKRKLSNNIATKLKRAQIKARLSNKNKRDKYLEALRIKNIPLLKIIDVSVMKMLLSILYLAEGAKNKSSAGLVLGSSDPNIIRFYLYLLYKCFDIDKLKFRLRIQCRSDQNIKKLEKYWSKTTKIKLEQFYPTYVDKRTIGKKTKHLKYKGVCVVHYFKTAIQLELEIFAKSMIEYLVMGR